MNSDHKNIINRYDKRIEKYGDSIKSLASGKESRRKLRFKSCHLNRGRNRGESCLIVRLGWAAIMVTMVVQSF